MKQPQQNEQMYQKNGNQQVYYMPYQPPNQIPVYDPQKVVPSKSAPTPDYSKIEPHLMGHYQQPTQNNFQFTQPSSNKIDSLPQPNPLLQQLSQQLHDLQLNSMPQVQKNDVEIAEQKEKYQLKEITNNHNPLNGELNDLKFVYSVPQIVDTDPITCVLEPTDELGGLFIGNYEAASNVDLLRKHKIRAVLTASIETGLKYAEEVIHFHEIIQAHDRENYDIVQHFDKAYDFIDRNRKYTSVLVHCFAGISRSASLIVAYLMKKYNLNFEKALWKLKSKRRQVNPNIGFIRQLQKYEKVIQSPQSINMAKSYPQPQQTNFHQQQPQYHPQQQIMKSLPSKELDVNPRASFFSPDQQYAQYTPQSYPKPQQQYPYNNNHELKYQQIPQPAPTYVPQ